MSVENVVGAPTVAASAVRDLLSTITAAGAGTLSHGTYNTWDKVKAEFQDVEVELVATYSGQPTTYGTSKFPTAAIAANGRHESRDEQGYEVGFTIGATTGHTLTAFVNNTAGPGWTSVEMKVYGVRSQERVVAPANVPVTHDQSGYLDIGNKRIQWGRVATNTEYNTVTFPQPFKDNEYSFNATIESNSTTQVFSITHINRTTTQIGTRKRYVQSNGNSGGQATSENFDWIAVGDKP
jgi:hypothetical protein